MIIGIDIDGVLIDDDTYRLDHMSKFCYENNLPEMIEPYAYENKCKWTDEILEDYRERYFFDYIKNAPAREFASEITQKLKKEEHQIIIITGRYKTQENSRIGEQMRKNTIDWLDKNQITYDEILFACVPKIKEVKEFKIDIMIEDKPETIIELAKITKVFCYNNPYNRDFKCENMTKVFSWYDIYRKINQV